ncbi:MAG: 3-isopropylmalate dehydratase small subunit, partial [Dehalococcoidia bacterium]
TGRNFGCGSSREHAPWALREMGFRVMIASSFADIFFNNSIQNGMLPIVLPEEQVQEIMERAQRRPGYKLSVNLESQTLYDSEGLEDVFEIDPSIKNRLLNGLDDIEVTLQSETAISDFEEKRAAWLSPTSA